MQGHTCMILSNLKLNLTFSNYSIFRWLQTWMQGSTVHNVCLLGLSSRTISDIYNTDTCKVLANCFMEWSSIVSHSLLGPSCCQRDMGPSSGHCCPEAHNRVTLLQIISTLIHWLTLSTLYFFQSKHIEHTRNSSIWEVEAEFFVRHRSILLPRIPVA